MRACVVLLLCMSTAGCFFGRGEDKCTKPQEYQQSRSVDPLQVPADLDQPNRAPLRIPEVDDDPQKPPRDRPCLEMPPSYSG